jgi:hypothetical protein
MIFRSNLFGVSSPKLCFEYFNFVLCDTSKAQLRGSSFFHVTTYFRKIIRNVVPLLMTEDLTKIFPL